MESIEIRRFGPVREGEIELAPLTILVGPNGSGKSYVAMALHSIDNTTAFSNFMDYYYLSDEADIGTSTEIEQKIDELRETGETEIPPHILNKVAEHFYKQAFSVGLTENIESIFATEVSDLIQLNKRRLRFDMNLRNDTGDMRLGCYLNQDSLNIDYFPEYNKSAVIESIEGEQRKHYRISSRGDSEDDALDIRSSVMAKERVYRYLFFYMVSKSFSPSSSSHYLPAGRAGLLQSHEVLARGAFDSLSQVGHERIELPAFSGVVSNYLNELVSLAGADEGELSDLAQEFEENTLDGEINVEKPDQRPYPEITFEQSGREFPLRLASTSVSELAPLVLYTKYVLSEDSVIVIEEPGGHLHPENQRKVADFILRLIDRDVKVIVTTHSDFFLDQINNSIRLSQVSKEKRKKEGLEDVSTISHEDVSAHVFTREGPHDFIIQNIEVDSFDGISLESFERVSDELYGQSYKIDRLLEQTAQGE
jgi:predicted ATPase